MSPGPLLASPRRRERERVAGSEAATTTFSWPGVCLMSDVSSAMKESCRCGVVRNMDVTSGLWSVSRRNCRPSSKNLKCLTALKAASSSLSKVEYLVPAPYSME